MNVGMFGKINFKAEVDAINAQHLAWVPAQKIGTTFTLPRFPLLAARVKRSQHDELQRFIEFETMRSRDGINLAQLALERGQVRESMIDQAHNGCLDAHPEWKSDSSVIGSVREGCKWGLAIAVTENSRVGENPPVARQWHMDAYNCLEEHSADKRVNGIFLDSVRWTFIKARAGLFQS